MQQGAKRLPPGPEKVEILDRKPESGPGRKSEAPARLP